MTIHTTANIDFAKSAAQHQRYLSHLTDNADILYIQEAKKIRLRGLLPAHWYTNQRIRTASTRGSALCWKAHTFDAAPKHRMRLGALPTGIKNGRPAVAAMLPRRILVTRAVLNGQKVGLIACHYPPERYSWLWPQMDRRLARIVRNLHAEGREIVIGADFNQHPSTVASVLNGRLSDTGIRFTAHSDGKIDGLLVTQGIKVVSGGTDTYGKDHRLTDHPAVYIETEGQK